MPGPCLPILSKLEFIFRNAYFPQIKSWKQLMSQLIPSLTAVAFVTTTLLFSGCGGTDNSSSNGSSSGEKKRIVFLSNGDDPFWDACRSGMDRAAEELGIKAVGLTHNMDKGSEFKVEKQIEKLEQYATQSDIAGVAISPVDANNRATAKALKTLRDKGVKVICVDSDMDHKKYRDSRFAYLGTNNKVGGEELGKAAKGLLPNGGNYATFVGVKTVANATDRIGGFAEGAGEQFTSLDSMADEGDENVAQENVKAILDKHDQVDALVGIWAYNAHAIVRVVEERGIRDDTTIVVFDAASLALTDMSKGKVDAMVVQNPYQMGYLSVKLIKAMVEEDGKTIREIYPSYDPESKTFSEADGDIYNTELRVVVPDEDSPLKAEMFRPETQFFYFNDFKRWLDKRQLVSS